MINFYQNFVFKLSLAYMCYSITFGVRVTLVEPSRAGFVSKAIAVITGNVTGQITFEQCDQTQPVLISGKIRGLKPGLHGFHVHQFGNFTDGCQTTGPHYNPFKNTHSSHDDTSRHAGDFGNILADENGIARINITDTVLSLSGPTSVLGRTVVVHENEDDLGKGKGKSKAESLKTGNAGRRIACGIIGIADETIPVFATN